MSDNQPAPATEAEQRRQELDQSKMMLARISNILQFALRNCDDETTWPIQLVHVVSDGPPEAIEFETITALCDHLNDLREQIIDEITSPRQHWLFAFRGTRLALSMGRIWTVSDGERVYDVVPAEGPSGEQDGLVNVGVPDTVMEQAEREDAAQAAAQRAEEEAAADAAAGASVDDDSAQSSED